MAIVHLKCAWCNGIFNFAWSSSEQLSLRIVLQIKKTYILYKSNLDHLESLMLTTREPYGQAFGVPPEFHLLMKYNSVTFSLQVQEWELEEKLPRNVCNF